MSKKRKRWRWSTGTRPHTAAVEERVPGGPIYGRVWNPKTNSWKRVSLKHTNKERAKAWALDQAAKLARGDEAIRMGKMTLSDVFTAYLKHRTPRKTEHEQQSDERRVEMWRWVLGHSRDPHDVSLAEWERFIDMRSSGVIDPRGREVEAKKRRPVRSRSVEADCNWLRWVFNWASKWRMPSGHYLMRENPVRGYEAPKEHNPQRPVATQDRYEAVRAVSDQVMMESRWGERLEQRSYLSELLDIVSGTGRRISPVCQLTYEDLRLERGPEEDRPDGAIRWPKSTDKMRRERTVAISPQVRQALDRIIHERPGIGAAPLFPSPEVAQQPMTRHLADKWLRKAEKLAELEPQKGSLWHAYRRKWATERKHHPDVDVAAAGGWENVQSLKTAYQQADAKTMLRVILEAGELREAQ